MKESVSTHHTVGESKPVVGCFGVCWLVWFTVHKQGDDFQRMINTPNLKNRVYLQQPHFRACRQNVLFRVLPLASQLARKPSPRLAMYASNAAPFPRDEIAYVLRSAGTAVPLYLLMCCNFLSCLLRCYILLSYCAIRS